MILPVALMTLLIVEATFALYALTPFYRMVATADLVVSGTITDVGEKTFTLEISRSLVGQQPKKAIKIHKFRNWPCACRWSKYEASQKVVVFLRKSDKSCHIIGGGGEGEMPIVDGYVYCRRLSIEGIPNEKYQVHGGTLRGQKINLEDFVDAIVNHRRCFGYGTQNLLGKNVKLFLQMCSDDFLARYRVRSKVHEFLAKQSSDTVKESKKYGKSKARAMLIDMDLVNVDGLVEHGTVNLCGSQITDAGLVYLKKLGEIETLNLDRTNITDAGLVHLKELGYLKTLRLDTPEITDAGLIHLKSLTSLEKLYLNHTKIKGAGLVHLKGLPNLKTVFLSYSTCFDVGLLHLKELTGLEFLSLAHTQITDKGLAHLEKINNLKILYLSGTKITDTGVAHLRKLRNLEELTLRETHITDAGLVHVQTLPNLSRLDISNTRITDAGVKHLVRLPNIKKLLLYNINISSNAAGELKKARPQLKIYGLKR